jgi:hypothetical protein
MVFERMTSSQLNLFGKLRFKKWNKANLCLNTEVQERQRELKNILNKKRVLLN